MDHGPGVVRVRALGACVQRSPHEGGNLVFGRNHEDVHLVVGRDDLRVSRRHGALTYRGSRWWVRNLGRLPIRVADSRLLFVDEEPIPLPIGFTPLVIHGSPGREHLVEVYVSDGAGGRRTRAEEITRGLAGHRRADGSHSPLDRRWFLRGRNGLPSDTTRLEGISTMAKVISTLFISADGVVEIDPDWHFPYFDENMGRAVVDDYDTSDVLLLGRKTYDSFAGAWPDREAAGGYDAPFATRLGDTRKVVVSRQPLEFCWRNSELIGGDLVEAVTALKADAGSRGILIPGSISVVQQLLAAGLVDELRLLVHPVAARRGRRLFDGGDEPYHLAVAATEAYPTGVIRVIYAPGPKPSAVSYDDVTGQLPDRR